MNICPPQLSIFRRLRIGPLFLSLGFVLQLSRKHCIQAPIRRTLTKLNLSSNWSKLGSQPMLLLRFLVSLWFQHLFERLPLRLRLWPFRTISQPCRAFSPQLISCHDSASTSHVCRIMCCWYVMPTYLTILLNFPYTVRHELTIISFTLYPLSSKGPWSNQASRRFPCGNC
jgi:hypothetical protein